MHNLRKVDQWSGVWTALITPLNSQGEIDEVSLSSLIEAQVSAGIRGLVIAGSTGEGSLLSAPTFEALLQGAAALVKGRIPLVAGLGIGGTAACLKNIELARRYGYSGVLASPPAYVRPPQRGLVEHYLKLAQGALPICIYEIPGRAGVSLSLETLVELAHDSRTIAQNLISIKDATANIERALEEKRLLKDRFALLTGDDGTFAPFLAAGGQGVISVVSHLVPRSMIHILKSFEKGDAREAMNEQNRIAPLVQAIFSESNPIPVKSLLAAQGKIREAHFCEPLCPMRKDGLEKLVQLSEKIKDRS